MHYSQIGQVSITDDKYLLPSTKSGWVEPASPMELITSPREAPQARWPNPFSNHGPEMNSKPYLSVVAHVFSYLGYFMTRTWWCGQNLSFLPAHSHGALKHDRTNGVSLYALSRYTRKASPQFCRWYAISAPQVLNAPNVIIFKDCLHAFAGGSCCQSLMSVEQD